MSDYELIPEEAYENLPQEPIEQFAVLVRVAEANLGRLLDQSNSGDYATELRSQFMSTISGIADALGVEGLPSISNDLASYEKYQKFRVYLAGIVARLRLQSNLVAKPFSVQLGQVTRARIQRDINQLRVSIEDSDLPSAKKDALRNKLAELETELSKQRLSFARTMQITASIATILGSGATALANAPKAKETIVHIIQLIGEDKVKEEEERLRLMPPPKAIPHFTSSDTEQKSPPSGFDLDDEIPF
jgi:hypothetical protein